MENKLDIIAEKLHEIDKTLQRNTDSLEHHIKRTDLLEQDMKSRSEEVKADLKPIKAHVAFVNNILKAVGVLASIVLFAKQMGWM